MQNPSIEMCFVGRTSSGNKQLMLGDIVRLPEVYMLDIDIETPHPSLPMLPKRTLVQAEAGYAFIAMLLGTCPQLLVPNATEEIGDRALLALSHAGFVPIPQCTTALQTLGNHIKLLEGLLTRAGIPAPERPHMSAQSEKVVPIRAKHPKE